MCYLLASATGSSDLQEGLDSAEMTIEKIWQSQLEMRDEARHQAELNEKQSLVIGQLLEENSLLKTKVEAMDQRMEGMVGSTCVYY